MGLAIIGGDLGGFFMAFVLFGGVGGSDRALATPRQPQQRAQAS